VKTVWFSENSGIVIKSITFIDDTTFVQDKIAMRGTTELARGTYSLQGDTLTINGKTTRIYGGNRFMFPDDREVYILPEKN
jgi:hypothetical protein